MATAKQWSFQQLAGPEKLLVLQGWSAPFGRPRHDPIVNAGIEVRKQVTYYTGKNVAPTIHFFGTQYKPFELRGRFMDAAIGTTGAARDLVRQWKDFVADQQEVRAKWGDILSYRVVVHDFDAHFEGEADVAWTLRAVVLVDEQGPITLRDTPAKTPIDIATQMRAALTAVDPFHSQVHGTIAGFLGQLSDQISVVVASIQAPFAAVYDTAQALSDFEVALSSDLVKLGSSLQTLKTALINLRDLNEVALDNIALMNVTMGASTNFSNVFSAADVTSLSADKVEADRQTANLMALIADMQDQIQKAQRGQKSSAKLAQQNDSWESIATQVFGDPSGARAIRDMNNVRYGSRPQPGKVYHVPRRA